MKLLTITFLFAVVLLSCKGGKNGDAEKLSDSLTEDSVKVNTGGFDSTEDSVLSESASMESGNWVNSNSLLDNYSLNNLKSKKTLKQIQWFDIPEIFKQSPLDTNTVSIYSDAALFLLKNEMYNEARIILLEITKKYPDKEEEWLALGDAQWGDGDEEAARESYTIYLNLMKKHNKDLVRIPKRVYERVD
ncbi:MAG: tetratricopeptide repeat protein [Parabacteroides sp.]|nr:tetratricopeptide repeat protein [Parabacteroides sp.]